MENEPIIEYHDVDIFQDDALILSDVNLTIDKGEFVYLIGRVGAGKTSLIKSLIAEIPLRKGTGSIAGFKLNKIKTKQIPLLRRKLGIVFQDFQLLSDRNVYSNLAFVLRATGWRSRKAIESRIEDVLEKVDLKIKAHKMPHQLSGGEQQRVAIARAMLNDPEIIIADEPTGNLDPETSDSIMRILFDICADSQITILMATHNHNLIKKFPSRTIKCEKGNLVESVYDEIDFDSLMEE